MADTSLDSNKSEIKLRPDLDTTLVRKIISKLREYNDPEIVLQEFGENLTKYGNEYFIHDDFYELNDKALSLNEFQNGKLMSESIPEKLTSFAIDLMRNFQKEYDCQTVSEKAIAEQAACAFVRGLDLQKKLQNALDTQERLNSGHDECKKNFSPKGFFHACQRATLGLHYVSILSKELDRANRQFLTSIHTLKSMTLAPIQITVKAKTADIEQNQLGQTNNSHE